MGAHGIAALFKRNKCLTELDISNLKDAIIEEIYRILKENKEKL